MGLAATLIGGFAGGFVARAYPLATSLWIGAFLQMASNLVFVWQAYVGHESLGADGRRSSVENFTGAIGTVIFVAYLSALCQSPLHTATQFALLTALAAVGRTYLSSGAGFVAEATGWALVLRRSARSTAMPSLALLWWLQVRGHFDSALARVLGEGAAGSTATIRLHALQRRAAAGSPPTACPRRDSRARRRPARHARAASP